MRKIKILSFIISSLFLFTSVFAVELTKDTVTGSPFRCTTSATSCTLWGLGITQIEPGTFSEHTNLTALSLGGNAITGNLVGAFEGLDNLISLDLQQNQITNLVTGSLFGLGALETINLNQNLISEVVGGACADVPNLTSISLNGNRIYHIPSGFFDYFASLPANSVDLDNNCIDTTTVFGSAIKSSWSSSQKVCPIVNYSTESTTNGSVTGTIVFTGGSSANRSTLNTNNPNPGEYVWTENGSHTFDLSSLNNSLLLKYTSVQGEVDWINASFGIPEILTIDLIPSLDLSYFGDYTVSTEIRNSNNVSVGAIEFEGINGDGGICIDYYLSGSCMSDNPHGGFSIPIVYSGNDIWKKDYIRPDHIYPQIGFASDHLYWYNAPSVMNLNKSNYTLLHFQNPFTMVGDMGFWIEFNADPEGSKTKNLNIYIVESGHDITSFNEDWTKKSYVKKVGSISRNDVKDHEHTVNSSHHVIYLSTNSDGTIADKNLDLNGDFWVILYASNAAGDSKGRDLKYQSTGCDTNGAWYLGDNSGWATSQVSQSFGCPDAHIHLARSNGYGDGINAEISVQYDDGMESTTIIQNTDFFFGDIPNLAPNPIEFTNPVGELSYNDNISVEWDDAVDPNNDIVLYSVYLLDASGAVEQTLITDTTFTGVALDISGLSDGEYFLSGSIYDGELYTSFYMTDNFTIDTQSPTATIDYIPDTDTNQDVVATITLNETGIITNNGGSNIYTFTENGTFTFEYQDLAGNTGEETVTVDWIDKTKVIAITLDQVPSSVSVKKAPLKYNKDFAYSYVLDDGYIEGYSNAFRYLNGGEVEEKSTIYPGLYYTDGAGNDIAFAGGFATTALSSSSGDIHDGTTPGYISWDEFDETYEAGWNVLHHGFGPSPVTDYLQNILSGVDYIRTHTQNNILLQHFIIPDGIEAFADYVFSGGMKSVSEQNTNFFFDGADHTVTSDPVIVNDLDMDKYAMYRKYYYDSLYNTGDITDDVNTVASLSTGSDKYWRHLFSHRVTTNEENLNGNLSRDKRKYLMDYVALNYGEEGDDSVWFVGPQDVYEYISNRNNITVATGLNSTELTISLDYGNTDPDFVRKSLSLLVDIQGANITSIDYEDGEFTQTSENVSDGLINLEWGLTADTSLSSKIEYYVSTAETGRTQNMVDLAQTWVDFLDTGSEKDSFQSRLDAIVIKGKMRKINLGKSTNVRGEWNTYNGYNTTSPVFEDLYCESLESTDLDLSISQSFTNKYAGESAAIDGDGVYPNIVISSNVGMYGTALDPATGTVKLSSLDTNKRYIVTLFGSTTNTQTSDRTVSIYNIGNQTKELNIRQNISNTVTFTGIFADSTGDIYINVAQKDSNWGYGLLGSIVIEEDTSYAGDLTPPVGTVSYSTTGMTNQDVIAILTLNESGTITNNGGLLTYTFTGNGSFTFEFEDEAGNTGEAIATVNWIDKDAPEITIDAYETTPTSGDITVTASTDEGTLNATSHTFTGNGSFTFIATDAAGNVTNETVTVTWIDKDAPEITIGSYNTGLTNQDVTITASTEDGTLNAESHTFTGNGSFTFIATDVAGNETSETVTVTWIDKTGITGSVSYDPATATSGDVTATVNLSETGTVTNNGGLLTYTFTGNGTFTFEFEDEAGNTGEATATVNWIDKEIVIDTELPIIIGVENGKTYTTSATFSITDNIGVTSVTLNGEVITERTNITLTTLGDYVLTAKDAADNTITIEFTIRKRTSSGGGGGYYVYPDEVEESTDITGENKEETIPAPVTTGSIDNTLSLEEEMLKAYNFAKEKNITTIQTFDKFEPEGKLIRMHLAKMISQFAIEILDKEELEDIDGCSNFDDIDGETQEMKTYIEMSCRLGLMGWESSQKKTLKEFDPNGEVTRAQFGTVLSRLLRGDKYSAQSGGLFYIRHLQALKINNIMRMIDGEWPNKLEIRGFVILMLLRVSDDVGVIDNLDYHRFVSFTLESSSGKKISGNENNIFSTDEMSVIIKGVGIPPNISKVRVDHTYSMGNGIYNNFYLKKYKPGDSEFIFYAYNKYGSLKFNDLNRYEFSLFNESDSLLSTNTVYIDHNF